ncbi:MAG: hypothetical protein WA477_00680 [Candidatus Sulfotelmatobacter sp.]
MGKILICVLAAALSLGTTLMVANKGRNSSNSDAALAQDGSFRDGLFVGRFTAGRGLPMRPPVGRWSTQRDREAFVAGYQRGYVAFAENATR